MQITLADGDQNDMILHILTAIVALACITCKLETYQHAWSWLPYGHENCAQA